eukprot:Lithocolla_globosa_v1_NODE_2520_length_1965_cov_146.627225.p2 type:complete len:121 gc:universal NODE_2520_length_1965_cov_146.627225:912-550(-)
MSDMQEKASLPKDDLNIDDYVRVKLDKKTFERSFEIKWNREVFQIVDKQGLNYTLDNGKRYRSSSLQKVPTKESNTQTDLVKKATKDRKVELELKREDIDQSNVLSSRTRNELKKNLDKC